MCVKSESSEGTNSFLNMEKLLAKPDFFQREKQNFFACCGVPGHGNEAPPRQEAALHRQPSRWDGGRLTPISAVETASHPR
jgi:hypothetical protein